MNQKGFAQILFISLLPLIITMFMITFIGANYIQLKTRTETVCITEQMKSQKIAAALLNTLLDLNPIVYALKLLDYGGTIAQLTAAVVNPLWLPLITELKHIVKIARRFLDGYQKSSIIAAAASAYSTSFYQVNQSLKKITEDHLRIFRLWLETKTKLYSATMKYGLAVKPDSKDLAPQYSIDRSKVNNMTIRNAWEIELKPLEFFKFFLSGTHKVTNICAVELVERNKRWHPQIVKDSLLSNFL